MPKKTKTGKTSTAATDKDDAPKATYAELIAHDPDFHLGSSKFDFPNGDQYEGEFCAHASGLVWRQGIGTYTTKDGHIYVGEWDGDKLLENKDIDITYPDGTKYLGTLQKNKYSGSGIYQLEEKVSVTCSFSDNKPIGEITLIDPNGRAWHGFAEEDECLLIQEHPFYRSIGKDLGKGHPKFKPTQKRGSQTSIRHSKTSESGAQAGLAYKDLRSTEKELFAKSRKTPSDLQLESSEWYQDYTTYCNTYGEIIRKVKTVGEGCLNNDEYEWYKKYTEFEKKYRQILNDHKCGIRKTKTQRDKLFEYIHSEEYKLMNKAVPVFYPKEESLDDCDSTCECEQIL